MHRGKKPQQLGFFNMLFFTTSYLSVRTYNHFKPCLNQNLRFPIFLEAEKILEDPMDMQSVLHTLMLSVWLDSASYSAHLKENPNATFPPLLSSSAENSSVSFKDRKNSWMPNSNFRQLLHNQVLSTLKFISLVLKLGDKETNGSHCMV